ncbi:hypothetical protein [Streptomyces sp. KL116D]|uniref:hypothetical protein n=1 Tax=Streptomyces sp. KL116D TaxID=3045152 RepID=UPI0035570B9C
MPPPPPSALRRRMREHDYVVADYIPALFESQSAGDHNADFADQLAAVRALPPPALLAAELARTLVDTTPPLRSRPRRRPRATRAAALDEYRNGDPGRRHGWRASSPTCRARQAYSTF